MADDKIRVGQPLYPEEEAVALGRGARGEDLSQGVGIHDEDGRERRCLMKDAKSSIIELSST